MTMNIERKSITIGIAFIHKPKKAKQNQIRFAFQSYF